MDRNREIAQDANIPSLSAGKAVEILSKAYLALAKAGKPFRLFPSTMLWGPPGVGKSQAVREIGEILERETGKKVVLTDVRLLLFNPVDLRGIPTFDKNREFAIWLKPKIFAMDPGDGTINILFLDEITAAPQSVQASAYQITLDRKVGEHGLPENCIVILAGNRLTDRSVATRMPKALANRLMHFEIRADFPSFLRWAVSRHLNEKVLGFLSFDSSNLMKFSAEEESLAFATPRSWEMVSRILNEIEPDPQKASPYIQGLLGKGLALAFLSYCRIYRGLPDPKDIFEGRFPPAGKGADVQYALVSSLTHYVFPRKEDFPKVRNTILYATEHLTPDFAYLLMDNYSYFRPGYQKDLLEKVPEYKEFIRKKGALLNGAGR